MKLVRKTSRYAVFDEVFETAEFDALREYVQLDPYASVHQHGWEKVWRPSDGNPLQGVAVRAEIAGDAAANPPANGGPVERRFPTHLAIDVLIRRLQFLAEDLPDLVGRAGHDFVALSARPFLYPAGSGLSWHTDIGFYSGAFTYYAHPRWSASWGGELMFADESACDRSLGEKIRMALVVEGGHPVGTAKTIVPPSLDQESVDAVLCERGAGEYVMALPNRLVILKQGTPHRVARVDTAAGDNVRCSIAGFFVAQRRTTS